MEGIFAAVSTDAEFGATEYSHLPLPGLNAGSDDPITVAVPIERRLIEGCGPQAIREAVRGAARSYTRDQLLTGPW